MPQVQYLDIPNIGSALGKLGGGFLEEMTNQYANSREEDALQKMLADMNPNASEEDVIQQLMGAKGVPFEKKKTISDIFSQSKARTESRKLANEKKSLEEQKYKTAQDFKERELKIKEDASLNKKSPTSDYQKVRQREEAKRTIELENELPKLDSALRTADEVEDLMRKTEGFGNLDLKSQAQLQVGAASLLEPMIKIYNPTGQLPKAKLDWINDKFGIRPTEPRMIQRGKLAGIRGLLTEQKKRLQERLQLMDTWDGSPPREVIQQFDKESEDLFDEIVDYDQKKIDSRNSIPEGRLKLKSPDGKLAHVSEKKAKELLKQGWKKS